jgi:hypothetical protein
MGDPLMADDVVALHPEAQSFVESVKNGTVPRHYQGRPLDVVNRPAHYAAGGIEVIDFIEQIVANYPPEIGYHIGNSSQSISRDEPL